jgi:hypothetical protein
MAHVHQIFMIQNTAKGGFYTLDTVGPVHPKTNSFSATFLKSGKVTPIQI